MARSRSSESAPTSDDEVAKLVDKQVTVEGRLVLHPPIAEPNVASPTPGPTLFDAGPITPRE